MYFIYIGTTLHVGHKNLYKNVKAMAHKKT